MLYKLKKFRVFQRIEWETSNINTIAEDIWWSNTPELDKGVNFPTGEEMVYLDNENRSFNLLPTEENASESIVPDYNVTVGSFGDIAIYPSHWEKSKDSGDVSLEGFCFKSRLEAECGSQSCNDRSTVHLPSNGGYGGNFIESGGWE